MDKICIMDKAFFYLDGLIIQNHDLGLKSKVWICYIFVIYLKLPFINIHTTFPNEENPIFI